MTHDAGYALRLDPWDVDYGAQLAADAPDNAELGHLVDTTVEVPGPFAPIAPRPCDVPQAIAFVDGVRRVDARLVVERTHGDAASDASGWSYGLFGSFAVGAAFVRRNAFAVFGEPRVSRLLVTSVPWPRDVRVAPGVTFRPVLAKDADPDAPLRAFQLEMRANEAAVAREVERDTELVVVDGPLTFDAANAAPALGFVKRIQNVYIGKETRVLASLRRGERSPLFAIRGTKRFPVLSWFLRIGTPVAGESELTGLVRVEVSERVGLAEARRLADVAAKVLPSLIPGRGRDPRAPQNLLPIGALESHLRRCMGDGRLVRRHVQSFLARGEAA